MLSHISTAPSSCSPTTTASFFVYFRSSLFTLASPTIKKLFPTKQRSQFYPSLFSRSQQRHCSNFSAPSSSAMDSPSIAAVDSVADDLRNKTFISTNNDSNNNSNKNKGVKLKLEELNWDHSFVRELPGDPRTDIMPREV